jgi:hypothetical protein
MVERVTVAALLAVACSGAPPELAVRDRSAEAVDFGAVAEPPAGRVLHGWGQFSGAWTQGLPRGRGDGADLAEYEETVAPLEPAMLSFYVAPVAKQVELLLPKLARLGDERGPFIVQLGLYFQSLQTELARGDLDDEVRSLAAGLRDLDLPVLLRIGYEFDNPWQSYQPETYVTAFRRIVGLLREVGACRVAPVWHASVLGLRDAPPEPWYPGDEFVAWWGISLFHWEELSAPALEGFLDRARAHRRPVVVAEAAPVLSSPWPFRVRGPRSQDEAERWYTSLFELLRRRPEIKALSLIAVNWRRLGADFPGWGWPDTRLRQWPTVAARVRQELSMPRYVGQSEWTAGAAERAARGICRPGASS